VLEDVRSQKENDVKRRVAASAVLSLVMMGLLVGLMALRAPGFDIQANGRHGRVAARSSAHRRDEVAEVKRQLRAGVHGAPARARA
jgi:hypothetical protein